MKNSFRKAKRIQKEKNFEKRKRCGACNQPSSSKYPKIPIQVYVMIYVIVAVGGGIVPEGRLLGPTGWSAPQNGLTWVGQHPRMA